jgi:type I restriction enzyme S subunit
MTQHWPTFRLKEICDISSSRRIRAHEYTESGVPFYRGKEIIEKHNGALRVSTDLFISEERFSEVCAKNGAPSAGDLLLTSVGTLGIPYVVQPGERFYFKDGNLTWFRNFEGLTSDYLYYWLLSPSGKAELKRCTIGSSQPAFTIVLLKDIEIALPPLPVQRRIASILSAYDDLIENNTRRIEILEEMARRLYEEWFVHFRFPGHEEVSFKESELGEIPEGWEVATVGDFVNIKRGKTITKKKIEPGNVPVVAGGLRPAYYHSTANTKGPLLTISASGANAGHVSLYYDDVWASDCSFIDSSESQHVYYYYLMLKVRQEEVTHLQRGSAQPHVYPKDVMGLQAVNAPLSLRESFMNHVGPMFRAIDTLLKKNVNLRAQRDLLLPKLVSGEIDVSDMPMPEDKEVEAA